MTGRTFLSNRLVQDVMGENAKKISIEDGRNTKDRKKWMHYLASRAVEWNRAVLRDMGHDDNAEENRRFGKRQAIYFGGEWEEWEEALAHEGVEWNALYKKRWTSLRLRLEGRDPTECVEEWKKLMCKKTKKERKRSEMKKADGGMNRPRTRSLSTIPVEKESEDHGSPIDLNELEERSVDNEEKLLDKMGRPSNSSVDQVKEEEKKGKKRKKVIREETSDEEECKIIKVNMKKQNKKKKFNEKEIPEEKETDPQSIVGREVNWRDDWRVTALWRQLNGWMEWEKKKKKEMKNLSHRINQFMIATAMREEHYEKKVKMANWIREVLARYWSVFNVQITGSSLCTIGAVNSNLDLYI
ncbi:hypothetical protein PENTCL1PPCAC_20031, partial [Pristionchus entomophagus]